MTRLSFRSKLVIWVGVFAIGFVLSSLFSYGTLGKVKVNGPIYRGIVQQKDLLADILPPPQYLIESYLLSLQMMAADKVALPAMIEKSKALAREYEDRRQYWSNELADGEAKTLLLDKAYTPGREFLDLLTGQLIPALQSGDLPKIEGLRAELREKYELHRVAIDALVKVAVATSTEREKNAEKVVQRDATLSVIISLGFLLVGGFVSWWIMRDIMRQLGGDPLHVAELVGQISTGDLRAKITLKAGDQSSLMASVKVLIETMERLAGTADVIGKGNLDAQVELLSEHDRLGRAINEMCRMLRNGRDADQRRNWLTDGHSQLSAALTGDLTTEQLADVAICQVGRYLEAGRGVFYLAREAAQPLELIGSYMYTERPISGERFGLGEGAVGQVAREKAPIVLTRTPDESAPIVTGTTCTLPRVTYTYPLLHEDDLLGVIELASLNPYDALKIEYLASACTLLASFLYVAEQRSRVRKLLLVTEAAEKEARAQSEQLREANAQMEEQQQQLQQQTEELQQTNAQMEEQQQQLQQQTEELQQTNAQMEEQQQQLEQQNQELRESRRLMDAKAKQLSQASQYKSEFLANMSHELRTPLNSIILLSKMMGNDVVPVAQPDAQKWSQIIHRSGEELLRLINDVLDLSKVEAGRMDLQLAPVASSDLLTACQDLFEHQARDQGLTFLVEDDLRGQFVTDRDKLAQILRNLLSNAFKFTKQGGITLRISRRVGEALPICIAVRDTGIGISEEKRALVFEAFQQADGSTSREFGGTGLGLTISLRFAELLGGTIELNSALGQGSEFVLRLPDVALVRAHGGQSSDATLQVGSALTESPAAPVTSAGRDDRDNLGGNDQVILLIDDDVVLGQTLMLINRRLGYKTLLARTGAQGLELAHRHRPQGILLDLGLPDMDGTQVLHQIKSNRALMATPVYIVSARDRDEALLRQGAAGFLQKPVDEKRLADAELVLLGEIAKGVGSAILLIENGSISASDVVRIVTPQNAQASCPVIVAAFEDDLGAVLREHACRLAIVDFGAGAVQQALASAAVLRAAKGDIALVFFGRQAPSQEEESSLRRYSDSVIVKAAQSEQRLLENVERFLREVPREPHATPAVLRSGVDSQRLAAKHILLTDDDPRNLFVLAAALERHGAKTSCAVNGKRALEFLETQRVDLIIMDIMMPEMDGYEAINAIRNNSVLSSIPILAITAKASPDDRARAMAAGADDYLAKPVDYDTLLAAVEKWCAGRAL